jgi:hypothetical protein
MSEKREGQKKYGQHEGFVARAQLKHDPNVYAIIQVDIDSEKEARRIFNLLLSPDAEVCDMQGMVTIYD